MRKHKLTGQGGKGSARRNANDQAYAEGWDKIFGKHKKADQDYTEQLKKNSIETTDKKIYKDSK